MVNISAMESGAYQQEYFVFNATHDQSNLTSLGDDPDRDSWMIELEMNPEYRAMVFIQRYYSIILSSIGVPCNTLSFLVLRRIKPLTPALLAMMFLAVTDTLYLMSALSDRVMENISTTNISCCMFMTACYLVQYMPIWLVVLLTLERVVAVWFPIKAAQVCTLSNARRSIVILFILDAIICIPHTFIYEDGPPTGPVCRIKFKYKKLVEQLMVADGVFFVFVPVLLLCLCNMMIIFRLRMSTGIYSETVGSSIREESKRQNRSITVMLLAVSITTIICLAPNMALALIGRKWNLSMTATPSIYARQRLLIWIITFLTSANNAINFFLYILSGRRFRNELYNMVTSWFRSPAGPI